MKITKQVIEELKHEDVLTVKRQKEILNEISDRTQEIWEFIVKTWGGNVEWWVFSNDIEYANGNGSSGGFFDVNLYEEFVEIDGENALYDTEDCPYSDGFPTELLVHENYKQTVEKEYKKWKEYIRTKHEKEAQLRETRKTKKRKAIEAAKSKLSPEELKLLKIK
jgi:hypothetical protein